MGHQASVNGGDGLRGGRKGERKNEQEGSFVCTDVDVEGSPRHIKHEKQGVQKNGYETFWIDGAW